MRRMFKMLFAAVVLVGTAAVLQPEPVEARPIWIMWYPELGGGGYCVGSFCNPAGLICCRIVRATE